MQNRFLVRLARTADMDAILEIEHASFGKDAYDRNLFAEYLRKCGRLFLVAYRGARICGYQITCVRENRAELVSIAVVPEFRGQGVASVMLESTLRRLKRRKVTRLLLMVRVRNRAARRFYEKFGFEKLRTVKGYYQGGGDGLLMERML
jgi:ribosomal-protein-alanine N-acetyltransferase